MISDSNTKLLQIARQPRFYKEKTEFKIKKRTATEEAVSVGLDATEQDVQAYTLARDGGKPFKRVAGSSFS